MTTIDKDQRGWTTAAEVDFVEHLASKQDAPGLLRGYLIGMAKRTEFSFDPNPALFTARERLELLDRRADARAVAL